MTKAILQVVFSVLLLVTYIIFQEQIEPIQYLVCGGAILLLGIPHGAVDHIIHRRVISGNKITISYQRFIGWYVLCMLAYLVVWIVFPLKAMFLFIALGIYHFGQEFTETLGVKVNSKVPFLVWGSVILLMPLFLNYQEANEYITSTTGAILPQLSFQTSLAVALLFPTISVTYFSYLFFRSRITNKQLMTVVLYTGMWMLIYFNAPFIIGFTIYFVLFHSFNAMEHQYTELSQVANKYSLKQYLKEISPLTFVSYAGIVIIFLFLDIRNWQHLTLYALVFISLLTLPHMLIFEQFYENRTANN